MLARVVGLAPGTFHTMLVRQDGSAWSTGTPPEIGFEPDTSSRFALVIKSGVIAAAAGTGYSMVLKQDGSVWTTGKESKGQLSLFDGSVNSRHTFCTVKMIPAAKGIAAGDYHSMILSREGRVWAMGWNNYGQLGDGFTFDRPRFVPAIAFGTKALAVSAGDLHSVVLKQDGSVWATGRNFNGQLGDGSNTDRHGFVQVMSGGAVYAAAGGYHTMVLKLDGSVWVTGWNSYGQLGDGSKTDRMSYVQVVSRGAKAIATGRRHSMILMQDGSVGATGYNEYGQLGDRLSMNRKDYARVISDGVKAVAAGAFHSMVLKEDGSIWATGSNKDGQFGDFSTTSSKTFVRLSPFANGSRYSHKKYYARIFAPSFTIWQQ